MNSFFTLHSFLEVGKTQDLPSKFWQTLGDALCLANQLGKNRNMAKLTSPRAYMRVRFVVAIDVSL
jgi:hypothetical protein